MPNPNLDSIVASAQNYQIQGGSSSIAVNDWVMIDPSAIDPDPYFHNLFQVSSLVGSEIGVQTLGADGSYFETILSTSWVMNVFRKQVKS